MTAALSSRQGRRTESTSAAARGGCHARSFDFVWAHPRAEELRRVFAFLEHRAACRSLGDARWQDMLVVLGGLSLKASMHQAINCLPRLAPEEPKHTLTLICPRKYQGASGRSVMHPFASCPADRAKPLGSFEIVPVDTLGAESCRQQELPHRVPLLPPPFSLGQQVQPQTVAATPRLRKTVAT